MNKTVTPEDSGGNSLWLVPILVLILGGGAWLTYWTGRQADSALRDRLLAQASAVARQVRPEAVAGLAFEGSDKEKPQFQRLRSQMMAYAGEALPLFGTEPKDLNIYSLARRGNDFLFGPGSFEERDPRASPPGTRYERPPAQLAGAFDSRLPQTVGPHAERDGTFVSAFAPVLDSRSGQAVLAIGMDVEAAAWKAEVARRCAEPLGFTLALVVVVAAAGWRARGSWRQASEPRGWLERCAWTVPVAVGGTLLSLWLARLVHQVQTRQHWETFARLAQAQVEHAHDWLREFRNMQLEGLGRFFDRSREVQRAEFHTYAGYLAQESGVQAWAWIPVVPGEDRVRFEASARASGLTNFGIWEKDGAGRRRTAAGRRCYYPVGFAEPPAGNEDALGYDLGSEPIRRAALEEAARTGLPTAAAPVALVQETGAQQGLLVFRPVFGSDPPKQLRGFALAVVRLGDLLQRIVSMEAIQQRSPTVLELRLLATHTRPAVPSSMAPTGRRRGGLQADDGALSLTAPLFAFGQTFALVARPAPAFAALYPTRAGVLAGLAGLGLTALLAALVDLMSRRHGELEAQVRRRTAELRAREASHRQQSERATALERFNTDLVENATDIVYSVDLEGNFTSANSAALRLLGYTHEEMLGLNVAQVVAPEQWECARRRMEQKLAAEKAGRDEVTTYELAVVTKSGERLWLEISSRLVRRDGVPVGIQGIGRDITQRKRAEEALHRRDAVLQAVSSAAARLLGPGAWPASVQETLGELGRAADASRAYAFEYHSGEDGTLRASQRFEWVAQGVAPQIENPALQGFPMAAAGFGRWVEALDRGGVIAGHIRDFPAGEQAVLAAQGIRSILVVPIAATGRPWGFLGFDECRAERVWSEPEIGALRLAARTLCAAIEREGREQALLVSSSRLGTLVRSLPSGLLFEDAERRVRFVNPAFCTLFGIPAPEVLVGADCRQAAEQAARAFAAPADFVAGVERAVAGGVAVRSESLRLADDRVFERDYVPVLEGRTCLGHLWHYRDITEPVRLRAIGDTRLHLLEFSAAHSLDELIEETLNRAEKLTGSAVGFYHLVDADRGTVTLQQWSTRTKAEFCQAEGKGMQYAMAQAGVWADCVRQRKPVIHNDCASLGHRKGLPQGHVPVIRELVVPVMRGEKIAALLGVGNKPADYTEEDVQTVAQLADLAWDIVGRTQAEEAVRESQARYQSLVETLPQGIFRKDREGRFTFANSQFCRALGRPAEQVLGKTDSDFYPPELAAKYRQDDQQVMATGELLDTIEENQVHGVGPRYVHVLKIPLRDASGRVEGVEGIFWDVTERRQAEKAVLHSLSLLSATLESTADGILVVDTAGRVASFNRRFLCLWRIPEDLAATKEDAKLLDFVLAQLKEPEVFLAKVRSLYASPEATSFDELEFKDGRVFERYSQPQRLGASVVGRVWSFRDVTERKRAAEEKDKLQAQLDQALRVESVGRLAGGVAHDFNNMLQAILGNVSLALMGLPHQSPLREHLEEIQKAAERSADLTRQLLAFARKQTIAPHALDLNDAVAGMLRMLRRLIGEDIDLAWLPGAEVGLVNMDPSQVDQILANLCVNARDAIGGSGGKVTIETANALFDQAYVAEHPEARAGEYVRLAVSDNGCGMSSEVRAHLFEPFFTTKGLGRGTGLGLATVYGIVKQNLGFINVYSEPGLGTTFQIHLPRHGVRPARTARDGSAPPPSRGHGTLLLVEDEPAILRVGQRFLERLGYTVLAASRPGEAIRLAREHVGEIQLLITDVVMPEMNGRDLARTLLSQHPNLKRLFMSGYTANVIAHHGVLDPGVHFIQKPFLPQGLADKVREALGE